MPAKVTQATGYISNEGLLTQVCESSGRMAVMRRDCVYFGKEICIFGVKVMCAIFFK
jgi:hypothetical protein